ncbi:MAG: PAS domain-containing sensor histidine kinase [Oscillospiraceae bacterium]|nr:PAS domain-containing sensor histidine kinase [Oscillospiraceae bacterium]MBR4579104.1 PAS domain-containing sensor histidine kinase [Oscillospiraceae bacterium]
MAGSELAQHPLGALFRMSPEAVCGVKGGSVVFCNGAARELFGRDVTGESAQSLFPGLELRDGEDLRAAMTVAGAAVTVSAVSYRELWVLTVRRQEPRPAVPEGAIRQLRLAAANLRLGMDRLVDPESEDPYAAVLYHSYYSLLHSVQQLSDLNALDRDAMVCRMVPVELGSLCRDLADSAAYYLGDAGVELCCRTPDVPCVVVGDRDRLEQLLLILLSNSLHAAQKGGRVELSLRLSGRQAFLTVADEGEGMDEESLRRAFEVRLDRAASAETGRAGLGLAIAEGIVRLHGGVLLLRTEEGRGTRASLRLPLSDMLPVEDRESVSRGPRRILTELSDILSSEAYGPHSRD